MTATTREQAGEYALLPVNPDDETMMNLCLHLVGEGETLGVAMERYRALCDALTPAADHSAQDLNMVKVPRDLHLITLGMLSSYVTTLAGIDFPDNDEGDYRQRLNETKRVAVNSTIAKLRALIVSADMLEKSRAALSPAGGGVVMPQQLTSVVKFLLGEGEIDGYGFGEQPPHHPPFWWRRHLREAIDALAKPQANSQEGSK